MTAHFLRQRGASLRLAGLISLVGFAGGQIAVLAHQALVEHVTCPEHGELLEAPNGGIAFAPAHSLRAATPTRGAPTTLAPQHVAGSHAHDHCTIASIAHKRATQATKPPTFGALTATHAVWPGHAEFTTTARYRLAPKASPPA